MNDWFLSKAIVLVPLMNMFIYVFFYQNVYLCFIKFKKGILIT